MSESQGVGGLVLAIGLVAISGLCLPLEGGWAPPLGAAALAAVGLAARPSPGSPERPPPWARVAVSVPLALATLVVLTVTAKIAAAIVMAFPAAWWAVAWLVLAPIASSRLFGRGAAGVGRARFGLALLCAALVPAFGVIGTRYEAGGIDARGTAFSGPIHGIHPFQTTAIVIDGHGPFDLPFNDYVEPDGHRGYGPEAYAEAMRLALDRIAALQFANGPERARIAFERAEVGIVRDQAIAERLDRDPPEGVQPRLFVRSGTHGQRSRVEFVCPGRTDDPKPHGRDDPSDDMCPSKYATEASAGLGLTGRWPGYAEARGNERVGLSRWLGETRSDDAVGQAWTLRERQWLAWIAIAGTVLIAAFGTHGRVVVLTLGRAGLVLVLVLVLGSWLATGPHAFRLRAFELGGRDAPWSVAWLPFVAAIAAGLHARVGSIRARSTAIAGVAVAGLVTFAAAGTLPALAWVSPAHTDDPLPWQTFIEGAAEAMPTLPGLDVLDREGAIAAGAVVLLLAFAVACLHGLAASVAWIRDRPPEAAHGWSTRIVLVLVGVAACALTISRKTEGASVLLPGAIGLLLVSASGRALLVWGRGAFAGRALVHGGAVVLASSLVLASLAAAPEPGHRFVQACGIAGGLALVLGLSVLVVPRTTPRA